MANGTRENDKKAWVSVKLLKFKSAMTSTVTKRYEVTSETIRLE